MRDVLIKRIALLVLPFMQMYGLYVIFHGHLSPGGSFAGGIIIGLGFVCLSLVYGLEKGLEKLSHDVSSAMESFGSLWYAAIGLVGVLKGANFLINKGSVVPLGEPGSLFSGGLILLITFGVGLKVSSTMVTLFYCLTEED